MSFCPNLSDPTVNKEFNELVAATNKNLAYYIWDLNGGNFLDKNSNGSANTEFTALLNTVGRFDAIKQTADKILKEDSITAEFQKPSTEGQIASEKTIRDLAARMSGRIGMRYTFISDRSQEFKGKLVNNNATINLAYATLDTPIHEILGHPIIRAIKNRGLDNRKIEVRKTTAGYQVKFTRPDGFIENSEIFKTEEEADKHAESYKIKGNPELYQNLVQELEYGRGKEVLDRIKRDYNYKNPSKNLEYFETADGVIYELYRWDLNRPIKYYKTDNTTQKGYLNGKQEITKEEFEKIRDTKALGEKYTLEEQQEEAIVELLGLMTAEKLDAVKDGKLISLLKRLLKAMKAFMKNVLQLKEVEIDKLPDNMTLSDLSDLLAYSNSKLILPGSEVVYTTPDNQQFKTYQEASNHISQLAKSVKDVDLDKNIPVNNIDKEIETLQKEFDNFKFEIEPFNKFTDVYTKKGRLRQNYWARKKDGTELFKGKAGETLTGDDYDGFVLDLDRGYGRSITKISDKEAEELYYAEENNLNTTTKASREKYAALERKIFNLKNNTLKNFIEKNKEYEQSKEIIEEWKKINNIQYNPEEIYSRGQEFSSVVGAYSSFDVNLMMQNLIHHIEDNEKAGGKFAISAYTKPVDKQIGHLEGGGGKIKFKIYPQSKDILWAANTDVYSGSVWDASEKISKDKKSELLGVSYTKYPSLKNIDSVQPNLASVVDDLAHHHNELGIVLTGNNFRLEYDEDIPNETKKIINGINSILDQKYGKVVKPEINNVAKEKVIKFQVKGEPNIFNTREEAQALANKLSQMDYMSTYVVTTIQVDKTSGIQPTQTQDTLKEDINSLTNKLTRFTDKYNEDIRNLSIEVDKLINEYSKTKDSKISNQIEELTEERNKLIEKRDNSLPKKEYTDQALINTKIAKLKEVAKKYPRSLIRSEVRPIADGRTSITQWGEDDLDFQKIPSVTPTLDSPQKLDNAIKVSHSLITARIITNEGLEGAKVLINSYPNYTQYVELLGDFGKRFTETEKRKIYVGNRKYIQSFIPEFLTLEEDEVLSKNANDMLESNKINPEDMASYVVKLAVSALPKLNLEGQLEVKDKMPVAEDYKATMDYLYKKLANKFTLQEQVDTLTKASIKKPSLRLINRWFKLDKPIETKEDLQNKIALFSTFANADTTFITAIIDQDAFKYVIPKTSLEESYYDRWKSNMTNSDFVYFNATTGSYMLNVKELTKAVEKKEGVKYVVDGLAFLKATGYPDPMPELVGEAKKIASFLTSLKEDININKIFDKEGLKINKELKALVQKTIEVNDYQETTNVVDINNNGRYSIGIPTAYDLMIGYYKNNDVEFLALDNNNLVKEIKAGNVTVYNLFNYKNSQNIASEFDKLDKGSMAVTYYNFVMDNIYPVMPSGDRGSEYALKIDWQSDNTPSIKNLRNLYLDNLDYMSLAEGSTNYGSLFAPVIEILGNSTDATEIDLMLEEFIGEEAANAEQFFAEVAPEYYKKNKDKLDFEEFITRYYYSLVQQSALFTGNVQNYKDPFKRFTTFTSTRSAMANDDSINAAINEHYKRLDKKKADGYIKTLVFKDIEMSFPEMNKAFGLTAEEYKKDSEVYDGAGVLTIDEAREILIKADKWNKDLDKWYAYEAGLTEELPEVGAPIYKLISTGPLYNEDNTPYKDINVPHIYKSAYFVLSPRNATGALKDVYEKMVAKQVGLGVFKSGSKAQNIGINELNGEYDTIQNINYDFLGFNLDTSGLEKTYVTDGTQGRKLLITDLFGVDGTQRITTRKGIEPTKEYVKLLESKIHELDRLKRENFFEEIGVTKTPEGYKSIDNLEKLTERIESALLARKTSSVLENQVKEILGDEEKLVDALTERNKFENMIMAIYNTDVVKRKMPGEMFVQIPDLNNELKFYTKNAAGYTNLAEVKVTLPKKLIPFVKKLEGKTFEQKLTLFNTMIAEGKVDKRILTLVPFRIPTQLQNGIEAVEIKEFLSPTQANTMIVPNGITVKAGSDFDVDKLTSYIPHFAIKGKELVYVDKVIDSSELSKSINELKKDIDFAKLGQIRLLNKDTRAEDEITDEELGELFEIHSDVIEKAQPELKEKLAEYNYLKMFTKKNLLENKIIDLSVDILTSKEVQGNLLTPDNTEQLQEASLKVINKLGLKKAFPKGNNPANPLTNYSKLTFKNLIETRNALITFKSLVGQAALAATNHALAQKAELSYQNPDFNLYFAGYNNTTDDIFSLHNNYAGDDKISFLLKQFISASVDVSKENNDFIAYVNINNRTFGVVQTLIRMGVPVNTVFAFINQPILRDLQEKLEENNSVANLDRRSASEIEAEVARKYGSIQTYKDLKEGKASLNIFNEPSLDKMLKKDLSSAEKLNQLHILAQYNIYKQAADDINNLQQAINVDTKQSGKSLAENFLRKLRLEEVKSSGKFINIDNLLYDTVLKQQQLSSDEVENLYTSLFKFSMHSTTPGKNLRNLYYETFSPILMSGDLLQGLERLDRFLTTFQILENGGVANYYKKLLVDGEAVLDLIKKKKQYKDNILLQQLVPMLPEEARATYNTKLFNKRYTLYEQENLIAGFRELMVKEPELAKKLIMQQLLQSGASLSQNSYQNILPEEYLALSKKALKTTTFTPEDVMRKFVLTHWKANELFKTKYIATSKGSELIELKVRQGTEFIRVKNRDKEMFFYQSTGETVEGKTLFVRVEPLGNYPWAINVKGVKAQPKTIIQAPKAVKSTTKSTVKRTNKTSFVEEEGYSTAETVDLGASPNTLKNIWLKLTMEQLKHLKSRNINNFGDFSTEVGIKESAGLSEEEAVETILSCK
jgi:hypothetical protein